MKLSHVIGAALLGLAFSSAAHAQVVPTQPGTAVGSPGMPTTSGVPTTTPGTPIMPGTTVGSPGMSTTTAPGTTIMPGTTDGTIPTSALPPTIGGTRPAGAPATGTSTRATRTRTRTTTTPASTPRP